MKHLCLTKQDCLEKDFNKIIFKKVIMNNYSYLFFEIINCCHYFVSFSVLIIIIVINFPLDTGKIG